MTTVNDVKDYLFSIASLEMKAGFDNVGFLVGRGGASIAKILVSLDITNEVISEAMDIGASLIVSHHPMFFSLNSVTDADITGNQIVSMLSGGLSAICMHTNLDAARDGVNDTLAVKIGIASKDEEVELLSEDGRLSTGEVFSYGRVGHLKHPHSMVEYLEILKTALNANGLRYHDAGREVYKVAIVGGSGGDMIAHAVTKGCDTFITADIKYHVFLQAKEYGINLIDGDHFCTENVVIDVLADKLGAAFPDTEVAISRRHAQTAMFYT
ncbi:MAG: Nif3-like dinuclear metal center hexameric protein [Oscillospiraceae bacterium]|nr:Nif3-like dinuclear metal center hexameric protein [Oscillospiraceae bacterium]